MKCRTCSKFGGSAIPEVGRGLDYTHMWICNDASTMDATVNALKKNKKDNMNMIYIQYHVTCSNKIIIMNDVCLFLFVNLISLCTIYLLNCNIILHIYNEMNTNESVVFHLK